MSKSSRLYDHAKWVEECFQVTTLPAILRKQARVLARRSRKKSLEGGKS